MTRSRFTIGRLMIAVAVAAVVLALSVEWGGVVAVGLGIGLGLGWGAFSLCRGRRAWAGTGLGLLTSLVIGLVAWADAAGEAFLLTIPAVQALIGVVAAPATLACVLILGDRPEAIPPGWRRWLTVAAGVGLPLLAASALVANWPLGLMFRLARPELEALARRAEAGEAIPFPARAGAFTIEGVRVDPTGNGNVLLMTRTNPSGPAGFVRLVAPMAYNAGARPLMIPSNINISLDGEWHFQDED